MSNLMRTGLVIINTFNLTMLRKPEIHTHFSSHDFENKIFKISRERILQIKQAESF